MKVSFAATPEQADAVAVLAFEKAELSGPADEIDRAASGAIRKAIKASRFSGSAGELIELLAPAGVEADRVIVLGAGHADGLDAAGLEKLGASCVRALLTSGSRSLSLRLDEIGVDPAAAARAGFGAQLAAYRFDAYRTKLTEKKKPSLKTLSVVTSDPKAAKAAWKDCEALADGVAFAQPGGGGQGRHEDGRRQEGSGEVAHVR